MDDVIDRIARLRKIKERAAQMEWMSADADRREQSEMVEDLEQRLVDSREQMVGNDVLSMVSYYKFASRLEHRRRTEQSILDELETAAEEKMDEVRERAMERQIMETIAENREEERRIEEKRTENNVLSDHGSIRWLRIRAEKEESG
jgi:flagellar export protein FliJ